MRIGVDLGGTKIEAIALSDDGAECARLRIPSPRDDYHATIQAIRGVVDAVMTQAGLTPTEAGKMPIGIGTPGSLSPSTGLMRNANSTWLNDRPFGRDLEQALARPVRLANDANCFAISEARDGGGAGANVVFGVILGTGVGGGIVVNGVLLNGVGGIAGEWGHNPLPGADLKTAPLCWCGRRGCIESYLSGPAMALEFGESGVTAADIAGRTDPAAVAAVDLYVSRLARAFGWVVNMLDPDVIVLGGGLSNIERLYADVPEALQPHVFADEMRVRIVPNQHGDSSGVRGAAWLWTD